MKVLFAEGLHVPAKIAQSAQAGQAGRGEIGGNHAQDRFGRMGHGVHHVIEFSSLVGVAGRMAPELFQRTGFISIGGEVVSILHWHKGALGRDQVQAMFVQLQFLNHFRPQQADHVGADRVLEAGEDLLGHGRTA